MMKIHNLKQRLGHALLLIVAVVGAITLFTNLSFTGGPAKVSAAECVLTYDAPTKTLTVEPGDFPTDFKFKANVSTAETIVFVSESNSADKVIAPVNCQSLFANLTNLKHFKGLQNFDTKHVTNMDSMFLGCTKLEILNLNTFDTAKVTQMQYMFSQCSKLTSLNVRGFDTAEVLNMRNMFDGCVALRHLDLTAFETAKVTTMEGLFMDCSSLTTLDLSGFDTSSVESMQSMFEGTSNLSKLDLTAFNTENVWTMKYMFNQSGVSSLDLSSFNTAKVTTMFWMFCQCTNLKTLDLSSFNTSKVATTNGMTLMFGSTDALWKLTLGSAFTFVDPNQPGLGNPILDTVFNYNLKVNSTKWLHKTGGSDLSPIGDYEYVANEIVMNKALGTTDTYIWQGDLGDTTTKYVVQPSYTITIPATLSMSKDTPVATGAIELGAYPKLPYSAHTISVTESSTNHWVLTTPGGDNGPRYDLINDEPNGEILFTADGEQGAQVKNIYAQLQDSAHQFQYAGVYSDHINFTVQIVEE
ncbi:MAG: DUF285 domain-containing protein [Lactobacillaceae bacterium]|jgi:surface protein|nr:DUF285 domain-containing protein [Lactobacillaceae bacterium]